MGVFFDPSAIDTVRKKNIILDTNILTSLQTSPQYFQDFFLVFNNFTLLIDPIIKLEFVRGAFSESDYKRKTEFLNYEAFSIMADHQDIYRKVYEESFNIARIYSHNGKPNIPLGDVLIISRLMQYGDNVVILTEDQQDFTTLLFDRLAVVSIEKRTKDSTLSLDHLVALSFSQKKFEDCSSKLPKTRIAK